MDGRTFRWWPIGFVVTDLAFGCSWRTASDEEEQPALARHSGDPRIRAGSISSGWPPRAAGGRCTAARGRGSVAASHDRPCPGKAEEVFLGFLETTEEPGQLGKLGRPYEVVEVIGRGGWASSSRRSTVPWARFVVIKVLASSWPPSATACRR